MDSPHLPHRHPNPSPSSSGSNWTSKAINDILVLGVCGVFFCVIIFLLVACVFAVLRRRVYFLELNRGSSWLWRREDMSRPRTRIRGLDSKIIQALPTFVYTSQDLESEERLECTICLSEFEEGEKVRVLPNCKHNFHVECIDMWFRSHSNCPLCRINVEPHAQAILLGDYIDGAFSSRGTDSSVVVVDSGVIEQGQSSGEGVDDGSNNFSAPSESEEISSTNASESPRLSRLHSLKIMLSRGREGKVFPSGLHQTPSESEGNSS